MEIETHVINSVLSMLTVTFFLGFIIHSYFLHDSEDKKSGKTEWMVHSSISILKVLFALFEIGYGIFSGVFAIKVDGYHMMVDCIANIFMWIMTAIDTSKYKQYKLEIMKALVVALIMITAGLINFIDAISEIVTPRIKSSEMFLMGIPITIAGIASNFLEGSTLANTLQSGDVVHLMVVHVVIDSVISLITITSSSLSAHLNIPFAKMYFDPLAGLTGSLIMIVFSSKKLLKSMKAITEKQLDDETIQTIKGCFQAVLEDLFNGEPPVVISAIESFMKTASAHNSEIIIKATLSHKNTSRRIEFGEITKIKERVVSNITQNNELKLRVKIEDVEINFDN